MKGYEQHVAEQIIPRTRIYDADMSEGVLDAVQAEFCHALTAEAAA